MDGEPNEVREYLTPDGANPFRRWLRALKDRHARARIRVRLNRLRLGNLGDARSVGDGVHELRVSVGPGYRVYFGSIGGSVYLLLCGGDKRNQAADIEKAKEYWHDYKERAP
jgi:putative addiction module killer protein